MAASQDHHLTVLIASPIENDLVSRIRAFAPNRVTVLHDASMLGVPRYPGDHNGHPFDLTDPQRTQWLDWLSRADVLFDFDRKNAAALPSLAPKLRWIQATSSGIGEFLQRTGLDKSDIVFTNAAGIHAKPLAEFALLGLLYFFRDVPALNGFKARKHWERYTPDSLDGKRALIVGLGQVGREIGRQCASFGIDVWASRRTAGGDLPEGVTRWVDQNALRAVMPEIDALILACPLTPETRGLIGAAEIEALRPGSVLVNVARGGVIDEPALIRALSDGRLKGAALDVFATEPLPADNPLWNLPNVLFSPHSASTVVAENSRIVDLFLDNLERFMAGQPLRNRFDTTRGY